MNDLRELFLSELQDMYHAEKQLIKALPKMAKFAQAEELREAFESHLEETEMHVRRIEQVFDLLDERAKTKSCEGMAGIISEAQEMAKEFKKNTSLDAALICAAQKAEHYEITSYGCLCTWAELLDNREALSLLKANLREEKEADEKLTEIAESSRNMEAAQNDTGKPRGRLARALSTSR